MTVFPFYLNGTLNMKKTILCTCMALMGLGASAVASATDVNVVMELAKASGCFSCHSAKEKIVGPAFATIAEKYAGQKDAASDLVMSIQNGSSGKWGRVAMPKHSSIPVSDIKRLAEWVLTVKP